MMPPDRCGPKEALMTYIRGLVLLRRAVDVKDAAWDFVSGLRPDDPRYDTAWSRYLRLVNRVNRITRSVANLRYKRDT